MDGPRLSTPLPPTALGAQPTGGLHRPGGLPTAPPQVQGTDLNTAEKSLPVTTSTSVGGTIRFRPIGYGLVRGYLISAFVIGGLLTVAGAVERNGTAPLIAGCLILLMAAAFGYAMLPTSVRSIVVSPSEVVLPVMARAKVRVPIGDVRGVGLVCMAGGRFTVWRLVVWDGMGTPVSCTAFIANKGPNVLMEKQRVGVRTQNLYNTIIDRQGQLGTLRSSALQLQGPIAALPRVIAVWDPSTLHTRFT